MRSITGAKSRALITVVATGAAMSIGLLSGAAPASAHVRVEANSAAPGTTSVLTFRVPGESETGALITQLSVELPDVAAARTEAMPGWSARLDRDAAAGTVRSVTWTAAPGTGISSDQFALFRISVKLPEGGEPEHPAPVLTLTGNSARWLAGGALTVAAVAVAAALLARRRS
jgi:uncharacterized protein YcnI